MDLLGQVHEIIEELHYEENYALIISYEARQDDYGFHQVIPQLIELYLLAYSRRLTFFLLFESVKSLLEGYSCCDNSFYSLRVRGREILRVDCNLI